MVPVSSGSALSALDHIALAWVPDPLKTHSGGLADQISLLTSSYAPSASAKDHAWHDQRNNN